MPTRFDLGSCCVLPIRGQANVAPPIAAINSRRCTAYPAPDALNPSVSNFRHRSKRSEIRNVPKGDTIIPPVQSSCLRQTAHPRASLAAIKITA